MDSGLPLAVLIAVFGSGRWDQESQVQSARPGRYLVIVIGSMAWPLPRMAPDWPVGVGMGA